MNLYRKITKTLGIAAMGLVLSLNISAKEGQPQLVSPAPSASQPDNTQLRFTRNVIIICQLIEADNVDSLGQLLGDISIATLNDIYVDDANLTHFAALKGKALVLDYLLERGMNINAAPKEGETPLIIAASQGHEACVDVLLRRSAQCNLQCLGNKYMALHFAAQFGFLNIVQKLVAADPTTVNALDYIGCPPLWLAVINDRVPVVRYLIEQCCANINVCMNTDFGRLNSFKIAIYLSSFNVVEYLACNHSSENDINRGLAFAQEMLVPENLQKLGLSPEKIQASKDIESFLRAFSLAYQASRINLAHYSYVA